MSTKKPRYGRVTGEILKLYADMRDLVQRRNEISGEVNEAWRKINPTGSIEPQECDSDDLARYEKAVKVACAEDPRLKEEHERLAIAYQKARFFAIFGRKLDEVEQVAASMSCGLRAKQEAWLTLLRWKIEYLESEVLRALIYKAREERDKVFLEAVAQAIRKAPKVHGNMDVKFIMLLREIYEKGMTLTQFRQAIEEKDPDAGAYDDIYHKLRRVGINENNF